MRQTTVIAGYFDISRQILHAEESLTERYAFLRRLTTHKKPVQTGLKCTFAPRFRAGSRLYTALLPLNL